MSKPFCPLFYHPTNVMVIDDDQSFLDSACDTIEEILPYVMYTDPRKAFQDLRSQTFHLNELSKMISEQDFQDWPRHDYESFQINFKQLQGQLTEPNRYQKTVVVVIDQKMTAMEGLVFCQKVRDAGLPVKCILLTGFLGIDEAVQALNDGVIDAYLKKEDPELPQKLQDYVKQFAWEQFQDFTESLTGSIAHIMKPLYDEQFLKVFQKISAEYQVAEFYVLDSSCSFLLLDREGASKILFVRKVSTTGLIEPPNFHLK